ncbi:MAG: hypothetical protein NXI24_17480 [bacterium]|nr:hypothetical protein [bacterium]
MSVEAGAARPLAAAAADDERRSVAREVFVSGAGVCEAAGPAISYRPRLNNALEQELYAKARRKSAIEEWRVRSFSAEDFAGQGRSPLINPHLRAQDVAFSEALRSAGLLRKIGRKQSRRVGVIYIDFYGNTSSLERELSSRELYYLDVYPTYLLQNHNISGFSMKTRGERNGVPEAFDVARSLIRSGELDVVVLGGVFPVYSYLFLSEALEDAAWLKGQRLPERGGSCELCERSVFLVLEGDDAANARGQAARFRIGDPVHYRASGESLADAWKRRRQLRFRESESDQPAHIFGGVYRAAAPEIEFASFAEQYAQAQCVDLSADGDSGHLNALKPFYQNYTKHSATNVERDESTRPAILHTWDRSGCGSELWIEPAPQRSGGDSK